MTTKVGVVLATGFEEVEAFTPVDMLRRAGATVITAGLDAESVAGSHGIEVVADTTFEKLDISELDMIFLPGGMPGTLNLLNSDAVTAAIKYMYEKGKWIAAICAAPSVLAKAGILDHHRFTIHPAEQGRVISQPENEPVVVDGNVITGRASGSSLPFAFKLIEVLFGINRVEEVNRGVLA